MNEMTEESFAALVYHATALVRGIREVADATTDTEQWSPLYRCQVSLTAVAAILIATHDPFGVRQEDAQLKALAVAVRDWNRRSTPVRPAKPADPPTPERFPLAPDPQLAAWCERCQLYHIPEVSKCLILFPDEKR